jgi:predicted phosphodiesterase
MFKKIASIILIILLVTSAAIFLFNFSSSPKAKEDFSRFLKEESAISLSGRTLFISDLHLSNLLKIQADIDVDNLVIVGDLFNTPPDFFALGNKEAAFRQVLKKILYKGAAPNVYYVLSEYRHDPRIENWQGNIGLINFNVIGEKGHFLIDGKEVIAIHGDSFNKTGFVPCGISYLARFFGNSAQLPLEKLWKNLNGISDETWLIMGHSHVSGIDYQSRVANAGSAIGVPRPLQASTRTGILFDGDKVELTSY